MRKNKPGRKPQFDKLVIKALRDEGNLSYSEIAEKLGMKSRQLARYYYIQAIKGGAVDNSGY
jgi:DNA-binding transcriptional regulator YiaG